MFPRAWPGDGGGGGEGPLPGEEKPLPHVQTRFSCLFALVPRGRSDLRALGGFSDNPGVVVVETCSPPPQLPSPNWPSAGRRFLSSLVELAQSDGPWSRRWNCSGLGKEVLQCAERFLSRLVLDGTVNHGLPKLVFIELAPPPREPGSHDAGNPGRKRPGPGLVEESGS